MYRQSRVAFCCILYFVFGLTSVQAEVEWSSLSIRTPTPVPNPVPPPSSPYLGHLDAPGNVRPYNIWEDNCHTAANSGLEVCSVSPKVRKVGIVACGGDPEESPSHHTVNYIVLKTGRTCLANWGRRCCWKANQVPPDLKGSLDALLCAAWACGDQYGSETRSMEAGKRVETPGPAACAREVSKEFGFDREGYEPCLKCCDRRGDMWEAEESNGGAKAKVEFLRGCKQSCSGIFQNGEKKVPHLNDSAGLRRGRICMKGVSSWSAGSYLEQCRSCCLDAARVKDFPYDQLSSCMAVCNSEYK